MKSRKGTPAAFVDVNDMEELWKTYSFMRNEEKPMKDRFFPFRETAADPLDKIVGI